MKTETEPSQRRRLVVWWSLAGSALLASLALLFWAGFRSGQTPSPTTQLVTDQVVVNRPPEGSPVPTNQPLELDPPPGPADPLPAPDGESGQSLAPDDVAETKLPDDWDELSPLDKISLNPFDCDLSRQEIDLDSGQCRQPATLSSKSRPWNPMALNRVSTSEVEDQPLKIDCYVQDLSYLLNSPSQFPGLALGRPNPAQSSSIGLTQPDPSTPLVGNKNQGFRHCLLRATLEMTIDGFYFPNGCRTWQPGFVKLVGGGGGQTKSYDSLAAPGPNTLCTRIVVPVAKGQQIEQLFLFEVPDSDLDLELTQIRFDWLEPKLVFTGDFAFEIKANPL